MSPTELEILREAGRDLIASLPAEDRTRFVLPWMWRAGVREGPDSGVSRVRLRAALLPLQDAAN